MKNKSASQTARKLARNVILLATTALALSASSTLAADATWIDGISTWGDPDNWDTHRVPDSGTNAFINNGGTAQISADAPMAEALSLTLGLNAGESGTVQVSPGFSDLSVGGAIFVGKRGKGNLTCTFGTTTSATASIASLTGGSLPPSNGSATIDGTSTRWIISGRCDVGGYNDIPGGVALLSVTNGGTVNVTAGNLRVYGSGTLTGNGTVTTTGGTSIDGTLEPRGTLTIGGDVTFTSSSASMQYNVSQSSWDRVEVSGTARLNGRLSVTITGTATGDFPLLHTSSLLLSFSSFSVTYTGCLAPSIVYDYVNGYVYLHVESTC